MYFQIHRLAIKAFCPKYFYTGRNAPFHPSSFSTIAAAAAKSLQSCPTLCDPTDAAYQLWSMALELQLWSPRATTTEARVP